MDPHPCMASNRLPHFLSYACGLHSRDDRRPERVKYLRPSAWTCHGTDPKALSKRLEVSGRRLAATVSGRCGCAREKIGVSFASQSVDVAEQASVQELAV